MKKFKRGEKVLIYSCEECVGGGAGFIIDKDISEKDKPAYLVEDLFTVDKITRWVKPENLSKLNFEKPKSLLEKIKGVFQWLKN